MGSRNLMDSFRYALEGIAYAVKTQRNIRIHLVAATIVLICSMALRVTRIELILLLISISMVIICELLNTAIERAVDTATLEYHPIAKVAKDVAAGAVLVSAINSVLIGVLIFSKYIWSIIERTVR
ncbi:MAG: diacylglycerol kinase family protein [Caulobacteraceae bacterium]